ncbi:MAPEG family protein [Parasulfitobacter algicola]|uniref:MAPEG family protein n=1 Tax=Parasulfitobacter algicola TaxID=2614809 RepID=A0ABX2ITC8_9RHOB|nr:MAPEG family protein [Sulfitobacter algicola]NSX55800.1 MAPEG family protein [Sulfitobacter algicola]
MMLEQYYAFSIYLGLSILILLWLAMNVGKVRGQQKISIGDGGNPHLIRAMRGQANFVELVPLALLGMLAMAALGAPAWAIHVLGVALTVGRILHGMHFVKQDAPGWQRTVGTMLTMLVLVLLALGLIAHAIYGLAFTVPV